MTTIDSSNYASGFTGLYQNAGIALFVAAVGIVGHDLLSRRRNVTPSQAADIRSRHGVGEQGSASMDDYTMGYLYRARCFVPSRPASPPSKWPFAWIWKAICLPESYYLKRIGLDGTTYVRFLRACWYSIFILTITITTVLLPIHLDHAPATIPEDSISRASVSALVQNPAAKGLLWIHVMLLWWMSLVWGLAMTWVGIGVVQHRRNMVRSLLRQDSTSPSPFVKPVSDDKHRGWYYRTLIVGNLPQNMISESKLTAYLTQRLQETESNLKAIATVRQVVPFAKKIPLSVLPLQRRTDFQEDIISQDQLESELVSEVLIIKRSVELYSAYTKREECLRDLESAHIRLAKNVFKHVKKSTKKKSKEEEPLITSLLPFLDTDTDANVWEALSQISPQHLDQYQPRTRISPLWKFWRRQNVATIDYKLARLNLLSKLVEDLRTREPSCRPSAVTFITFSTPMLAMKAKRLIVRDKNFGPLCFCHHAPEARDINWKRIIKTDRTESLVREPIVYIAIWALTIFWLIPISLLVGVFSLDNIGKLVPGIAKIFDHHPQARSTISNLLPTILVNVIMFLVPTMLTQLSLRGQNIFTMTRLHKLVMSRYWKFLAINLLIFFCIATTALQTFLSIFRSSNVHFNPLVVTASAFPSSSVFYVSWLLLVCGVHNFFELILFGIALINHGILRKTITPRKRYDVALPRSFSYFSYIPMHLLVVAVTLVFSLLNPIVMAFSLAYFSFAIVVFKNQFSRVYWRRYYELNGQLVYRRLMRYSFDSLVIAQVVIMALMFVSRFPSYGGACIPTIVLTVIYKLALSRWFLMHTKSLDKEEAEIICGIQQQIKDEISGRKKDIDDDDRESNHVATSKTMKSRIYNGFIFLPRFVTRILPPLQSVRETEDAYARIDDPWRLRKLSNKLGASENRISLASATPSELKTMTVPIENNEKDVKGKYASGELSTMVKLHPRLVRDDRPDPSATYDNPCLTKDLDYHLWLPRNPLARLHLDDTVDYYGRVLVSSEGGNGTIEGTHHANLSARVGAGDIEREEGQALAVESSARPTTSNNNVLLAIKPKPQVTEDSNQIPQEKYVEQSSNTLKHTTTSSINTPKDDNISLQPRPQLDSSRNSSSSISSIFKRTRQWSTSTASYRNSQNLSENNNHPMRQSSGATSIDVQEYAEWEILKESSKVQQEEEEYLDKSNRHKEK